MIEAIIYDFDGVIADSEVVANAVLADAVTELGHHTSLEDSYRDYMGKRLEDVLSAIEARIGRPLHPDFAAQFQARTFARFKSDLRPVEGAIAYIRAFAGLRSGIASSSSPERLALCLDVLGLAAHFEERVYSASMVARGKPDPDIFLFAAEKLGIAPAACLVIEDSASGVRAARAAGMRVIGLLAAGHIQPGHAETLRDAGAHALAPDYDTAARITRDLVAATV